jgi:hypothetical protein
MKSCGVENKEVRRCGVDGKAAGAQIKIEAKLEAALNTVPRGLKFTSDKAKYLAYGCVERSAATVNKTRLASGLTASFEKIRRRWLRLQLILVQSYLPRWILRII